MKILPKKSIDGHFSVPGDKSISHRALILGAINKGKLHINNFLMGDDCLATAMCLMQMGIEIEINKNDVVVNGRGLHGFSAPKDVLYAGNSGTTLRLLTGLLAGQNFNSIIDGDDSLRQRPMDRVILPLTQMGANIDGNFAPIKIFGTKLRGIHYKMPINSAQVKSAIMLAGLYADGETAVEELGCNLIRNHTEIMIDYLKSGGSTIYVPGDFSSAAFLIAAGLLLADEGLMIKDVGVNSTRTGLLDALSQMGADINLLNKRNISGEDIADIYVKKSRLQGIALQANIVPRMIDEVPIFAVLSLFAEGKTIIRNAAELKIKESNRIETMTTELKKLGANIAATNDGMEIYGGFPLHGAELYSHADHRVAMSLAIAALASRGPSLIKNAACVDISFPGFFDKIL